MKKRIPALISLVLLSACSFNLSFSMDDAPTATAIEPAPTEAAVLPDTQEPPTETLPPDTPVPPTETPPPDTPFPPTETPPPDTPVPPTETAPPPPPVALLLDPMTVTSISIYATFGEGEALRSLAFSPDGTVLASSGGNTGDFTIRLWDVETGALLRTLEEHTGIVWEVEFSPDGELLASVSNDATCKIWDWRTGSLIRSLDFPAAVSSVTFTPDGGTLAVGGVVEFPDAAVWTFKVPTWQPIMKLEEFWNIPAIVFTPDGGTMVGGGTSRNSRIWRMSDGVDLYTLYHSSQVADLAISPDGSTVASGLAEGAVWIWQVETGTLVHKLSDFSDWVEHVAYAVDGSFLVAGSRDGLLVVYDASDYALIFTTRPPDGNGLFALSPDGKILATAGRDGLIHLWRHEP